METITHLVKDKNALDKGTRCGKQPNCAVLTPVPVHHCITHEINKVSCAECADHYAHQNKTTEQMNLDTAFKIIAAKDKEIEQLENDIEHLKFEATTLRHAFRSAINEPTAFKIIKL